MLAKDFIKLMTNQLINELEKRREIKIHELKLISLSEVAELFSLSEQSVRKKIMHQSNFPKAVRLTEKGDLRFYKAEIEAYLIDLKNQDY